MGDHRVALRSAAAAAAGEHAAAMICARWLGLTFAEARLLIRAAPLTLPKRFSEPAATDLAAALRTAGVPAELVREDARVALPCATHSGLVSDGACTRCGRWMCALCQRQGDPERCPDCARRHRRGRRFRRGRIAVLLVVLLGVSLWASRTVMRRQARMSWQASVRVEVVLVTVGVVPAATTDALRAQLPDLERLFERELSRYRAGPLPPFRLHALGPVGVATPPPMPPAATGLLARFRYYRALRRYLAPIDAHVGATSGGDLRVYLAVAAAPPGATRLEFAEGAAAAGGDVGVVSTSIDAGSAEFALIALGHELLHTVGATDKYDARGRPRTPEGLCEPAAEPRYPQPCAEIMVGEIALTATQSRPATRLTDVRVGAATAAEIGWR